jgi:hypothetical protein
MVSLSWVIIELLTAVEAVLLREGEMASLQTQM